jgi:site-specific DNA recombinase
MDPNHNPRSVPARFEMLAPDLVDLPAERHQRLGDILADLFEGLLRSGSALTSPSGRRPPGGDEGDAMRIATYTRISTDEDHQPFSLGAQADRLAKYVASQDGWRLVRTFTDQMSGATLERPNLQEALLEAKAQRFDLLLVYRVDRLSRSVRGLAHVLEELDGAGVAFRSATEPFDTSSPAGRMMVQMLGVFAEFERATIIDRVIAGMERKAARGEWCGGQRPFGYLIDKATSTLVVKDDEAALVPYIFGLYVKDRLGSNAIARHLNEQGYRTRNGRPWSHMSVLTVLRNRAYLGEVFFRGSYHQSSHQPLVDTAVFATAQELLAERGEDQGACRSNSYDYLLSRLLICNRCGKRYVGAAAGGRGGRYEYYVCFSRQRYGTKTCSAERLPARELEQAVLAALGDLYDHSNLVEQAFAVATQHFQENRGEVEDERRRVQGEIKRTEAAIDRYLAAFEDGTMPPSQCRPRLEQLSNKLRQLQTREAELDNADQHEPYAPNLDQASAIRGRLAEALQRGDTPNVKAILREVIDAIEVRDRRVRPRFRVPAAVRTRAGLAPPTGFEPVLRLERCVGAPS